MEAHDRVNVLLVDDQPGKLLSYEVMLAELGENLIKASSAKEALEHLLKTDVAVILVDVCMPELDGFELAKMIREHPRFQRIAIIFISAIHVSETDYLRGYDAGAVDYVPVPVIPEVLRAKVRVFAELYRKTRQLEYLNRELESRVSERTAALEASNARLLQSEQGRSLALAAGDMGSWNYDFESDLWTWDEGHRRIFGVERHFEPTLESIRRAVHPDDIAALQSAFAELSETNNTYRTELRVTRPNGEVRSCAIAAVAGYDGSGKMVRVSGVIVDITDRKDAETRQMLLAREVDHRARNALAVVQAIIRLAKADSIDGYVHAVEGRIRALAQTHELLSQSRWQGADVQRLVSEEVAPYRTGANAVCIEGASILVAPESAQSIALILHELATNAAKYGALSARNGKLEIRWASENGRLTLDWTESGGPRAQRPISTGFGMKIIHAHLNSPDKGSAAFDWRPEGLHCRIVIPCGRVAGAVRLDHPRAPAKSNGSAQLAFGPRLLLVEDEALIGILIHDMLTDWGFEPSEPYFRIEDAIAAAKLNRFEGAVLDMNLNGKPVYPLAELLEAQSVPFVFLTGYGQHAVDTRFAAYPVLQKPVAPEALKAALEGVCSKPKAMA